MRSESSLPRHTYLEEIADRCARPIGQETAYEVISALVEKEFSHKAIAFAPYMLDKNISAQGLYAHKSYPDLYYEPSTLGGDKHHIALYDLTHEKMLVIGDHSHESLPHKVAPLTLATQQRLLDDYNLNPFPLPPFADLIDLMRMAPRDEALLKRSDDDHRKNTHQGERTRWLNNYVDVMFQTKARSFRTEYKVPLFPLDEILCVRSTDLEKTSKHFTQFYNLKDGHFINVFSDYHNKPTGSGYREYAIKQGAMNEKHKVFVTNALFLIEETAITHPKNIIDFNDVDLRLPDLPKRIDLNSLRYK